MARRDEEMNILALVFCHPILITFSLILIIHSIIHSCYFFKSTTQRRSQHVGYSSLLQILCRNTVSEFHAKAPHSFIHYGDLYSAPSRLLLRSAPDPCTAKKKSFESRVECVRKNPGEQSLRQRKPIPHRWTNHRECTGLGCGCTSKRNKE